MITIVTSNDLNKRLQPYGIAQKTLIFKKKY